MGSRGYAWFLYDGGYGFVLGVVLGAVVGFEFGFVFDFVFVAVWHMRAFLQTRLKKNALMKCCSECGIRWSAERRCCRLRFWHRFSDQFCASVRSFWHHFCIVFEIGFVGFLKHCGIILASFLRSILWDS